MGKRPKNTVITIIYNGLCGFKSTRTLANRRARDLGDAADHPRAAL
jgi:hypothetical protein